jgi:hypothetical protein
MNIRQHYETTLVETDSDLAGTFLVIPARSLPEGYDAAEPQRFLEEFGFREVSRIPPGAIVSVIAFCLSPTSGEYIARLQESGEVPQLPFVPEQLQFAEYLTMARVIPFEQSPLDAESIGNLIAKTSGWGLGAYAGFVVGAGTPLVFVTVPAGMLIFGAAAGLAAGLEKGLRESVSERVAEFVRKWRH